MEISHFGEILSLATALCFIGCTMFFEAAGKRVGAFNVNLFKLFFALIILSVLQGFRVGTPFDLNLSPKSAILLSISGVIGFLFGDMCMMTSYKLIGSRITLLIMASVPFITTVLDVVFLHASIGGFVVFGTLLTMAGIAGTIIYRGRFEKLQKIDPKGYVFAAGGALGQAVGLFFSKLAITDMNAFHATQVRVFAALLAYLIVMLITKKAAKAIACIKDKKSMLLILGGSVVGPFLGVSCSLMALQYTTIGISTTLTSTSPILIIPVAIWIYKQKVSLTEILCAVVSVIGIAFFFI